MFGTFCVLLSPVVHGLQSMVNALFQPLTFFGIPPWPVNTWFEPLNFLGDGCAFGFPI